MRAGLRQPRCGQIESALETRERNWLGVVPKILPMKTLLRYVSIITVLSLGALSYAGDAKKEDATKDDCCKECCKDGSCAKCKEEKSAKEKDAQKTAEKLPEKK